MTRLLIVRPEAGARETAVRASAMGLDPVLAPILAVRPLPWTPPDPAAFDALLFTSANAARLGGEGLRRLRGLPCYAVGEATAAAARAAGFADVRVGSGDGATAAALAAAQGARRLLHVCGSDHKPLATPRVTITACPVYAADMLPSLPATAAAALREGAIVLLHSPRMARHFAALSDAAGVAREGVTLAAISDATADAAGTGWQAKSAADRPRDEALLELAAKLCKIGSGPGTGTRR